MADNVTFPVQGLAKLNEMAPFDYMISLGVDCRVRYQISLNLYRRYKPDAPIEDFGKELYAPGRMQGSPGTLFFDWQITPWTAVMECIRTGFEGIFQKENLKLTEGGLVQDSKTGITHVHSFKKTNGRVTPEAIDAEYDKERAKTLYLADKFLELLAGNERILYVRASSTPQELDAFVKLVTTQYPAHDFHVIGVRGGNAGPRIIASGHGYTMIEIDPAIEKPAAAHWQGDDTRWGNLLDQISLKSQVTCGT